MRCYGRGFPRLAHPLFLDSMCSTSGISLMVDHWREAGESDVSVLSAASGAPTRGGDGMKRDTAAHQRVARPSITPHLCSSSDQGRITDLVACIFMNHGLP